MRDTEVNTGATAVTVRLAVPATLVAPAEASAEMVADPTTNAVTSPDDETDAIAAAEDAHAMLAESGAPFWSSADAVSCEVSPTESAVVPVTTTLVSIGGATTDTPNAALTLADPLIAIAVIVADPVPIAVTRPFADTVATDAAEVAHVTVAVITVPAWSAVVTVSCSVWPVTNKLPAPPAAEMVTVVSTGDEPGGPEPGDKGAPVVPGSPHPIATSQTNPGKPTDRLPGTNFVTTGSISRPIALWRSASSPLSMTQMKRLVVAALACGPAAAIAQKPLTLAKPEVEYAEPFTQISGIRELKDGRVLVSDARDKTLQLIDLRPVQQ